MRIRHRALKPFLLVCLASGFVACATVANLEVKDGPSESDDRDDPNRPPDAAADAASDAASDIGLAVDAADALPPPPPSVCSCPIEQGCCANNGTTTCTPVAGADTCRVNGGLFLRCSAGDLFNGRACCFTSDNKGTFYGANCEDAGAQLCASQAECFEGTCTTLGPSGCRGVALQACVGKKLLPVCP